MNTAGPSHDPEWWKGWSDNDRHCTSAIYDSALSSCQLKGWFIGQQGRVSSSCLNQGLMGFTQPYLQMSETYLSSFQIWRKIFCPLIQYTAIDDHFKVCLQIWHFCVPLTQPCANVEVICKNLYFAHFHWSSCHFLYIYFFIILSNLRRYKMLTKWDAFD